MAKSIIQTERECYICAKLGFHTYKNLEEHHFIPGIAKRRLCEADGLKAFLCQYHHREVHSADSKWMNPLKKEAQIRYMEYYGRSEDEFRSRYGKSYL